MSLGIVKTQYGKISGVDLGNGITEYRGIPYAKPPIGELRWTPTQPADSWEGVMACDKYAPAAIQTWLLGNRADEIYYNGLPERSEDCLYINVITPAQSPEERLPVYIWYHDGGMTNGYSHGVEVNPLELVRHGIVVAQVGHRIGEFGYMALPQLREEQGQSGNYGVMDTVTAFNWVWDNIGEFGGNRDEITIGGQSGGTAKICALLMIPELKGKIKRLINQSGLKWLYTLKTQEEAETIGLEFLKTSGIDPHSTLAQLRVMDTFEIHKDLPVPFIPGDMTLDGVTLSRPFADALLDGAEGVSFLNSLTEGEADVFGSTAFGGAGKTISGAEEFYSHFKELLGDLYEKYDFENLIKVTDEDAWKTAISLASQGLTKKGRNNMSRNLMANRIFSELVYKRFPESKVYTYMFTHLLPKRNDWAEGDPVEILAPHGSDMWYSYHSLSDEVPPCRDWRGCDYEMARILSGYFVNFIKTGNPNSDGLAYWPVGDDTYSWLDMNTSPVAHERKTKLDELIYEFVKRYYEI